jgi:thiamine-phosphate pyrophosphorylase
VKGYYFITEAVLSRAGTLSDVAAAVAAGVALLPEIRRRVTLPLVAIGGITLASAPSVIEAAADAVCAISAVVTHPDVGGEIKKFQGLFRQDNHNNFEKFL